MAKKGVYTKKNVWDEAAALEVYRGDEKLDPGVNYFIFMLDQLGLPTHYSCEGHPGGFYIMFEAEYEQALEIKRPGFFTVEIEGENYWSMRFSTTHDEKQRVDALRWAAQAWEEKLGPLKWDKIVLHG